MDSRFAQSDEGFGECIQECTRQFKSASDALSEGLQLVVENVKFVRANWNEEYDRRLRESGFRGSLILLQEWRLHLETMKLYLAPILSDLVRTCERGDLNGWGEARREAERHDPVLGSATRPLCRCVVAFADFEEKAAQTSVVFNAYEEYERARK